MRKIKVLFVLSLLFISSIGDCAVQQNKTSQPSVSQPKKLRLGVLNLMSGGIIYMAKEKGFFLENNIDLQILTFESAQQVALAVASGDIEIGQSGLAATVYNLAGKGTLRIIAGCSREVNGWQGVAYMVSNRQWEKGVRAPSQLQNMTIGITDKGSSLHYAAGLLAEKYQFRLEEKLKIVPLRTVSLLKSALAAGQIDCGMIPDIVAHNLEEAKMAHIVGFVGNETPWQVTGVFASAKLLSQNKKLVEQYLEGYKKTCTYYHELFNQRAPELYSTEKHLDQSPERKSAATKIASFVKPNMSPLQISRHPVYIDPEGRIDLDSVNHQMKWYQARNMVDKGVVFDQLIESSLVKASAVKVSK